MKIKERMYQLNSLIKHFNNGGLDFNATDIEAIKCLLNKRQKLIDYLKKQIKECDKDIKRFKGNYNVYFAQLNDLNAIKKVYEEILSKIEKE